MAVPDTNTFTMQDVQDNVTGSPVDLVQAFANSTDSLFDPAYKGGKDSLLNFRNYGAATNTLSVLPLTRVFPISGGGYVFSVESNTSWKVENFTGSVWITISPPAFGSGDGNFTLTVPSNGSGSNRSGTIRVSTTAGSPVIFNDVLITQTG